MPETTHRECVNAWLERVGKDLPAQPLLGAFEVAFSAIYRRALLTLGEVTLAAIADRVLFDASKKFPMFSQVTVDPAGVRFAALEAAAASTDRDALAAGFSDLLADLLAVLGNLTAEILTPELHEELARVGREAPQGKSKKRQGNDGEENP